MMKRMMMKMKMIKRNQKKIKKIEKDGRAHV